MNKASVSLLSLAAFAALASVLPRAAHAETPLGVASLARSAGAVSARRGGVQERRRVRGQTHLHARSQARLRRGQARSSQTPARAIAHQGVWQRGCSS